MFNFLAQIRSIPIPGGREDLPTYIFCNDIVDCMKFFGGLIANLIFVGILIGSVIVFLIGAIFYLIGGTRADDEMLKKAKKILIYSVVAAVLASLAWVIINAVVSTLTFLTKEAYASDIFTFTEYKISVDSSEAIKGLIVTTTSSILNYIYWAALILSLIMILIASISYITSRGNEEKIKRATSTLKWAIIGVIVALISWVIIKLIMMFFGVQQSLFLKEVLAQGQTQQITATISEIFKRTIDLTRMVGFALAILFAIIAGIVYITSRGGESVKTANKAIFYLLIGIVIILLANVVVEIVKFILGV